MALKNAVIVAAKRTPFGTFGGALKAKSATELATIASQAALAEVDKQLGKGSASAASMVDDCYVGNVQQTSADAAYLARHVALKSGCEIPTPCLTVNRLCGSGFQSIINAAQSIALGEAEFVLTGGTESMSQAPMSSYTARWGSKLGQDLSYTDTLWAGLTDSHTKTPMAITAENLAEQYGVTREMCDKFAVESQKRWGAANEAGVYDREITPIELSVRGKPVVFDTDEHPKPQTDLAGAAKLPAVFKKDGTVTAGSASGICDGAAAVVVSSEEKCSDLGLTPLAHITSYHVSGCEPTIMGIGPVEAMRKALEKAGKTLDEMDLIEINEAFAAQAMSCMFELDPAYKESVLNDGQIMPDNFNKDGGAIALGHPLGASGARIMAHLAHELNRTKKQWAIGAACIGGGQGIAIVLENKSL